MPTINIDKELSEYRGYREEIKETLETNYQYQIFNGNIEEAYETLGKLMEYKLIDRDDPRIEKNNKSYVKGGVDKEHRFRYDYRVDTSYVPSWLFGSHENSRIITLNSIEHTGKRVEGNYEGKTVFPSRAFQVKIGFCNTARKVQIGIVEMYEILKESKKEANLDKIKTACTEGVYRLFSIEVQGNCISQYRNLGYALVRMGDSGDITCTFILKYSSIIGNWISIKDAESTLRKTLQTMTSASNFSFLIDDTKAIEEQAGLIASYGVNNKQQK